MSTNFEAIDNTTEQVNLLYEKLEFFKKYFGLTQQLRQALENNDLEQFNKLMEGRQIIIDQINELDRAYEPDAANNQTINTLQDEITSYIKKINAFDEEIKLNLQKAFKNIADSMHRLNTAWRTEAIYRKKAGQGQGFFINKKR